MMNYVAALSGRGMFYRGEKFIFCRAVKFGIFVQNAHEKTSRNTTV